MTGTGVTGTGMTGSGVETTDLTVLIVDDEGIARRRLRRQLQKMPQVEIVGEAADGEEALAAIVEHQPRLVLLDIRMPGMDGLALAERLPPATHVVFTTAHEEYAVGAFEAAAVDYLLKPIDSDRLAEALDRVRRLEAPAEGQELARLLRAATGNEEPPRVAARRGETLRLFDPREIARFHAEQGYTEFRHDGRRYLLDDSIVALAARLKPWGFLRVHRAELINLHQVKSLRRVDDSTIVELADGQRALVSRRQVRALKRALGVR